MGFAKKLASGERTFTQCGTPDYMAPEVVTSRGHGLAADWWSLGILIWELMQGAGPFAANSPGMTYAKIMRYKRTITRADEEGGRSNADEGTITCPRGFSNAATELIAGLLTVNPTERFGCGADGSAPIRAHPFFASIDWASLEARQLEAPYRPAVSSEKDLQYFATDDYSSSDEDEPPFEGDQGMFTEF